MPSTLPQKNLIVRSRFLFLYGYFGDLWTSTIIDGHILTTRTQKRWTIFILNYFRRPMSLTPTVTKVLESFVGQWVLYEVEGKIDNRQYGTLRGGSTTHELVDILNQRHQALENNFYL